MKKGTRNMAAIKIMASILLIVAVAGFGPHLTGGHGVSDGSGPAHRGVAQADPQGEHLHWQQATLTCPRCGGTSEHQVLAGRYNAKVCPHCNHLFQAYVPE